MSAWRGSENFNVFDYPAQADEPGPSEQPGHLEHLGLSEWPEHLAQSEQS